MAIGIETISAYAIAGFLFILIVNIMIRSAKRMSIILINVLLGGALFVMLNILGMKLTVNTVTVVLIGLLGVPGVLLVIIMKLILGVW